MDTTSFIDLRSIENLNKIFESDNESEESPPAPLQNDISNKDLRLQQINISSKSRRSTKNDIINLLIVEG